MLIKVINGPNLNLLGQRQKNIYGVHSLSDLEIEIRAKFPDTNFIFVQSNDEGVLIEEIHKSRQEQVDAIVLNAGAYTHYSYAIRDAILAIEIPTVEVHLSNIFAREKFRKKSVLSDVCVGVISGFGFWSYFLAIIFLTQKNKTNENLLV